MSSSSGFQIKVNKSNLKVVLAFIVKQLQAAKTQGKNGFWIFYTQFFLTGKQ